MRSFGLVEPFYALSIFPQAVPVCFLNWVVVLTEAVLLSLVPPTLILAAIGPCVVAETIFFIFDIFSVVSYTILIDVNSESVHVVSSPLTVVLSAIRPEVYTVALDLIVLPFAFVHRTVRPEILALTFLLASVVFTLVAGSLRPGFIALAVLQVLLPESLIP